MKKMTHIHIYIPLPPTSFSFKRKGEQEWRIKRLDQYEQDSSGSPGGVEGDLLRIDAAGRCQRETAVMKKLFLGPRPQKGVDES